jgi:hypothetical protein
LVTVFCHSIGFVVIISWRCTVHLVTECAIGTDDQHRRDAFGGIFRQDASSHGGFIVWMGMDSHEAKRCVGHGVTLLRSA